MMMVVARVPWKVLLWVVHLVVERGSTRVVSWVTMRGAQGVDGLAGQ